MTTLLALLWAAGTIACIVFLIRPRPNWPIVANRKRAGILLAAVFIGLPVLSSIVAPSGGSRSGAKVASSAPKTPEQIATDKKAEAEKKAADALKDMNDNPETYLTLEKTRASKGGFNTVLILGGTLKNTGKVAYKDPVIQCDVFSETQTPLGHVRETLYKAIPPGKSLRFSEFNMGFVQSVWERYSCEVKGATVVGTGE